MENKNTIVTRRDFYGALSIIWLFIMFIFGDLYRGSDSWPRAVLFVSPFIMAISYSIIALRSKKRDKDPNNSA